MITLLWSRLAFPCAGLVHADSVSVESDAQQVIFALDGDNTSVEYLIQYSGDAADFGWVVPIFGAMVSIEEGSKTRFDALAEHTAPLVDVIESPPPACGSESKGGRDFSNDFAEEDWIQGYTENFSYVVIPASELSSFSSWGEENGWNVSAIEGILPQYANDDNISLVLFNLRQDLDPDIFAQGPSVNIVYEGHEMRFPAMLSKTSPFPELHTIVYVEGEGTAQVTGWGSETVGDLSGELGSDSGDSLFLDRIREISNSSASFGVVYAGLGPDGNWVTRLDSIVTPAQNTQEPIFTLSDDQTEITTTITLYEEGMAWFWGLGLLLGLRRLKKHKRTQVSH